MYIQTRPCSLSLPHPHLLHSGRLYNHQVLDMIELGIDSYQTRQSFKVPLMLLWLTVTGSCWCVLTVQFYCLLVASTLQGVEGSSVCTKPCLIFTGDLFETDLNYTRLKNLFIGMNIFYLTDLYTKHVSLTYFLRLFSWTWFVSNPISWSWTCDVLYSFRRKALFQSL